MSEVEVRRSTRRRRTVSAYREGDRIVVLIPAGHSRRQEQEWIDQMVGRIEAREHRVRPSDGRLAERAWELSQSYLGGLARPASISWVSNQHRRWGSCTPADGTIRISDRVAALPRWVQDYVVLHELAHLGLDAVSLEVGRDVGQFLLAARALLGVEVPTAAVGIDHHELGAAKLRLAHGPLEGGAPFLGRHISHDNGHVSPPRRQHSSAQGAPSTHA